MNVPEAHIKNTAIIHIVTKYWDVINTNIRLKRH